MILNDMYIYISSMISSQIPSQMPSQMPSRSKMGKVCQSKSKIYGRKRP